MRQERRNCATEAFFLRLVESGHYKVYKNGLIVNTVTGNHLGQNKNGDYQKIGRRVNKSKTRTIYVHRLVWLALKGPIPKGYEVNHKNGVKHDNRLSNLELTTGQENVQHAYATGLNYGSGAKGSVNGGAKLSEKDLPKIIDMREAGASYEAIGKAFGVSTVSARNVVVGKTWPHIPRRKLNLKSAGRGVKHSSARLTEKQVRHIRRLADRGVTYQRIADHYALGHTTVNSIVNRKTWKHVQ